MCLLYWSKPSQGTSRDVNAFFRWSPRGDVVWIGAEKTSVVRIDDLTTFDVPIQTDFTQWYTSLHWSPNGEWVGFTTYDAMNSASYTLWLLNTKTGLGRSLGEQAVYAEVIPNDLGASFITEGASLALLPVGSDTRIPLSNELLQVQDPMLYPEQRIVSWSPDGITGVFVEGLTRENKTDLHLIVLRSDGTQVSDALIPSGDTSLGHIAVGSAKWVQCH